MKYSILSIALCLTVFTSCKDAPEADETEANAPENVEMAAGTVYNVKNDQSKITWTGTKATGRHEGTILLKSGKLTVSNDQVTGGDFVADMTTITPHDQDEEGNTKLQGHLKSEDFFDVTKYPDGMFEITAVAPITTAANDDVKLANATHNITGNLTLKGTSKSITFPARINITANEITADADFNIDRGEWNVNYGNDKSLGNKYIHPEINIKLTLVAAK